VLKNIYYKNKSLINKRKKNLAYNANNNILIIKLGAMGDVIRTTPLLHDLNGNIFWVTRRASIPLLPKDLISNIFDIDNSKHLDEFSFDIVICLDDEYEAASLATSVKKSELIGSYCNDSGELTYTESSSEWFDMGLISRFGKERADKLKMQNKKTYQEILFQMLGKKFNGEEYILNQDGLLNDGMGTDNFRIGIEKRAGERWLMKQWNKYDELASHLKNDGYEIVFFHQRSYISEYIKDIN
jgi:heptosyltransferase-2